MSLFQMETADYYLCRKCETAQALNVRICASCGAEHWPTLQFGEFFDFVERGEIIHAGKGGLVVGRDALDDDIPLICSVGAGIYQVQAFMQGGEYLMSPAATANHLNRLATLNAMQGVAPSLAYLNLNSATSVINANSTKPSTILWIKSGQFVVNRYATAQHLDELEMLNAG